VGAWVHFQAENVVKKTENRAAGTFILRIGQSSRPNRSSPNVSKNTKGRSGD
jgi:hypothetical protein